MKTVMKSVRMRMFKKFKEEEKMMNLETLMMKLVRRNSLLKILLLAEQYASSSKGIASIQLALLNAETSSSIKSQAILIGQL